MVSDQLGIRDALAELPAHTPAGRAAKAEVLWVMGGALCPPEPGEDARLEWSLIRDVIAAGGGAMPAGMVDGAES